MTSKPSLYLSFDIEDWHHVPFATPFLKRNSQWNEISVVQAGTRKILEILKRFDTTATFFVVGAVAEKYPELVREINDEGHDIGSHGYAHVTLDQMTPEEFETDLEKSAEILKHITGKRPVGYRAPLGSIGEKSIWALDILQKRGFHYDSSIYPSNPLVHSGLKNFSQDVHEIRKGLWEIPLAVENVAGLPLPLSGGFYLRAYPFRLSQHLLARRVARGTPTVLYFHSWEFALEYPRVIPFGLKHFVQYHNLATIPRRLEWFLDNHRFHPLSEGLPESLRN